MNNNKSHHTGKKSGSYQFKNPWESFKAYGLWDFFKCRINDWRKVDVNVKFTNIVKPDMNLINKPPLNGITATWVGHATYLLQFNNVNVLTDPIFSERCSAVQFAGPKRIIPACLKFENLPKINYVLISHNHYDHLDTNSVYALKDRVDEWFVPLGIKSFLTSCGIDDKNIHEMDWWDSVELKDNDIKIVCCPCQHFSGRTLTDRCATLWSSWSIISKTNRIYFSGDTGYRSCEKGMSLEDEKKLPTCPAFKQIGNQFGPFDLSCIAIGAYSPRHFMSPVHLSPEDAVDVHIDLKSKQSLAMHWGTFILTDEPLDEPPKRLKVAMEVNNLNPDDFLVLNHGETRHFEKKE